jgi:putative ABC transport system permease protein
MAKNGIQVKIAGIIQPKKDASNATLSTCICYTSKLTDYIIKRTDETDIIKEQEANPDINVLTGMKFEAADDE